MRETINEARANIIRNAILSDGDCCGSREWLDDHNVSRDELVAFLDAAVEYARAVDYREGRSDLPSTVVTKGVLMGGALKRSGAQLKLQVPPESVPQVQQLIDEEVFVSISPVELAVDMETGELG